MFSKIDVNGDERHPLYAWLTGEDVGPDAAGDVAWNFAKFLIGRTELARLPADEPCATDAIEKPRRASKAEGARRAGSDGSRREGGTMKGLNPGQPILTAKDLGRRFGDRTILKGASFSLQPGDRVGVLGVNGVGKSTLMQILAGRDTEYDGHLHIAKGATVGYVSQEPELDFDKSVRENVEEAVAETRALLARYDEILKAWEDPAMMADEER